MSNIDFGVFVDEFNSHKVLHGNSKKKRALPIKLVRDLSSYPEQKRKIACYRYDLIQWIYSQLEGGWTQKNLEPLLEKKSTVLHEVKPSWRTVAIWWARYKLSGFDIVSLVPHDDKKGNNLDRLSKAEYKHYSEAVSLYLDETRPTIAAVFKKYKDRLIISNSKRQKVNKLKVLSYDGFYKRIKALPAYDVAVSRYGKDYADKHFHCVGAMVPPTRVLERVEIDHTPLDLILLDDELSIPLGRPYLTLLLDTYSKCVVGFHLGFREPSYHSVSKAIFNAVIPKGAVLDRFPSIAGDWPCSGKFENLVVDNGAEFWSESLEVVCKELNINVQYNPAGKPWLKPFVERFFGTVSKELIVNIPGKTFENILKKDRYNPVKDAVMHFSVFNELFHKWIVDVYHCDTGSRGITLPPRKAWEYAYEKLPTVKVDESDYVKLKLILGYSAYRRARESGIHMHNLRYDSPSLAAYRRKYVKKGHAGLLVKTDPDDISSIHVFLAEKKEYLSVPCVDPIGYTQGLSLLQHQINIRIQKAYVSSNISLEDLAKARIYIHERVLKESAELQRKPFGKVKSTARIAKYNNINSDENNSLVPKELPEMKEHRRDEQNKKLPLDDAWCDSVSDWDAY